MFEKLSISILGSTPADAPCRMWKGLRAEGWDAGPLWPIQCFSWGTSSVEEIGVGGEKDAA